MARHFNFGRSRPDVIERNKEVFTTHGLTKSREYNTWHGLKLRCLNKSAPDYHRYGGRGITVCKKWVNSFETFFKDMGKCPRGYHLDRIDNNGPYSKRNCRWVSARTNCLNKRTSRLVTYNGVTKNVVEWANDLGMSRAAFRYRLEAGWPIKKIMNTPINYANGHLGRVKK